MIIDEIHAFAGDDRGWHLLSVLERVGRLAGHELQRIGLSATVGNCLFLATKEESLIQAAGLIDLWSQGYIEPIIPPTLPYHILSQQLMALSLQESGIGRRDWFSWVEGVQGFSQIPNAAREQLVEWMLGKEILWEDEGILSIGREGEDTFGRRNFMELFSVFMSPPLFSILHGRQELGYVDETTFLGKQDGPRVLLLGGRSWLVNHIDWQRRIAFVEATDQKGRSRWKGEGGGLGYRLVQAIKGVLATDANADCWSRRAQEQINTARLDFPWLEFDSTATLAVASHAGRLNH